VVEAASGPVALNIIATQAVDLVLLDIVMPEMDGIEVLKRIRVAHSQAGLPVIMVTAKAENVDVVRALEEGANDYVTKPVDFAVALARVNNQLARKQVEATLHQHVEQLITLNRQLEKEIAERKQTEARMVHMAHHDALTGLANRVLFRDQLVRALSRPERRGSPLAILFLDLDQFKLVNDALGHAVGDAVLCAVAERLQASVQDADKVARLGSDEFAIIQTQVRRPEEVSALAQRVMETIETAFEIDGHRVIVGCSIGMVMSPSDGTDPDVLLKSADLALHRAKAEGRGVSRFFEAEMNIRAQVRRLVELQLRNALASGEFELFYQPLFNLKLERFTGFEALLRWNHPQRGIVPPGEFIDIAEEMGLIIALGKWVIEQACKQAATWPDDTRVAVNLSPSQFQTGTLIDIVGAALAAAGLPARRLEIEITENVLLDDDEMILSTLERLHGMGVRTCLDDFGTGFSSLSYLRRFPFDKIKIDQCFTRDLDCQGSSKPIVRAITALADSLGMITTAEGVETREQFEWLRDLGCTEVQGYLISRPVPARDIPSLSAKLDGARSAAAA
jgi:diguanylate cyclase (GGDEF)-like protein